MFFETQKDSRLSPCLSLSSIGLVTIAWLIDQHIKNLSAWKVFDSFPGLERPQHMSDTEDLTFNNQSVWAFFPLQAVYWSPNSSSHDGSCDRAGASSMLSSDCTSACECCACVNFPQNSFFSLSRQFASHSDSGMFVCIRLHSGRTEVQHQGPVFKKWTLLLTFESCKATVAVLGYKYGGFFLSPFPGFDSRSFLRRCSKVFVDFDPAVWFS